MAADQEPLPESTLQDESEAYDLFQRGMELLTNRHPAQAAMVLTSALRLEPDKNSIREALAQAQFAMGRYQHAADLFAAIAAAVPDSDYAHYCLGRCLRALGRDAEARAHLRLARALNPNSSLYRDALASDDAR
jgi:Flp pilus assembly protein TadD